jgi:hypothetical protein
MFTSSLMMTVYCSQITQSGNGVHSIMMEKLTQAGLGWGCTPTPFHYIYHSVHSCGVRCLDESAATLPLFLLYSYSIFTVLCGLATFFSFVFVLT